MSCFEIRVILKGVSE